MDPRVPTDPLHFPPAHGQTSCVLSTAVGRRLAANLTDDTGVSIFFVLFAKRLCYLCENCF